MMLTVRQSTLPSLWWEKPETSVVPISEKCTAAEAAAGAMPVASSSVDDGRRPPFLTEPADQAAYVATAATAVVPGGVLVLGSFAEDGPEACSGLPTARFSVTALGELFADWFEPEAGQRERHVTPWGAEQSFSWVRLRRRRSAGSRSAASSPRTRAPRGGASRR